MEGESSFLFFSCPSRERVREWLHPGPGLDIDDDYHFPYDEWQGGGIVFGNCLHPTAVDSLKALSFAAGQTGLQRVLDLGTGILAIAAALLGAKKVVAVDPNPLCVKTASGNVELNHQEKIVQVFAGRAEDFTDDPADLILANIYYEVI